MEVNYESIVNQSFSRRDATYPPKAITTSFVSDEYLAALNEISNQIATDKATTSPTLRRKHLFGCMKGKIKMAPDFDAPLFLY
ncbi:DUF2281 domain-containing protein [Pseudanabaena sp. ABRG5-3]|uniref:DUF2281 domain-containing protein n=1 Tax=Pseudanabaena sp. ABRG5-3 TaxID=685565 RepID=UPI000DC73848|nr:DUF2281 domain-containing protein [Pseudanabaena sp. ABRG5-3]BBC27184.1 hypothetical protein ABRG53_f011 [Pseudanabaena sp. ABRG5-3]